MSSTRSFIATAFIALQIALMPTEASTPSGATYHVYDGVTPPQTTCNIPFDGLMVTAYHALGTDLKCGDCVRVTNKNGGKSAVVKVIDLGGARGFDLSKQAFDAIDTANQDGYLAGHMDIEYEKVGCGGDVPPVPTPSDVTPVPTPSEVPTTPPTTLTPTPGSDSGSANDVSGDDGDDDGDDDSESDGGYSGRRLRFVISN